MEIANKSTAVVLSETIDVGHLDLQKALFYKTPGGFTGLKYGDKDYTRISLRRALPIGLPSAYISVADAENKEIGIIRALTELTDDQLSIITAELDRRYYCPSIVEIKSVKDKLGYVYIEMKIQGDAQTFDRNCAVKDVNKNIRLIDDDRLIIFDVDGNRFIINSLSKLDKKSLKMLEPYMF